LQASPPLQMPNKRERPHPGDKTDVDGKTPHKNRRTGYSDAELEAGARRIVEGKETERAVAEATGISKSSLHRYRSLHLYDPRAL
jgi:hypothetical protein